MASPLIGVVAIAIGIVFFAFGLLFLHSCTGTALLLFGIGLFALGGAAALFGGVMVLYPTALLAAILIIAGLVIGLGASGCML
jgi:hypothetical protein